MNPKLITEKVSEAKKASKKRKFPQTVDLIVTLKDMDLKKSENQVDFYVQLPHSRGKKVKVGALIGPELKPKAEGVFDNVILEKDFNTEKANLKAIASDITFFVAQGNLMPKVAAAFGRILGPKGKMPNPKAGCIVDLKTDLKALYAKLQKLIRISVKTQPQLQCGVGIEPMSDDELASNIDTIYEQLIHALPKGVHNVSKVFIKLTMGPPVEVK